MQLSREKLEGIYYIQEAVIKESCIYIAFQDMSSLVNC